MSVLQQAVTSAYSGIVDRFLSLFGPTVAVPPTPEQIAAENRAARQRAVKEVDEALDGLKAAIETVDEPLLEMTSTRPLAGLTVRRDELASADDGVDPAAFDKSATNLKRDAMVATIKANDYAAAAVRIAKQRSATRVVLDQAGPAVKSMLTPGPLTGRLDALQKDTTISAGADGLEAAVSEREAAARLLLSDATAARDSETRVLTERWTAEMDVRSKAVVDTLAKSGDERSRLEGILARAEGKAEAGAYVEAFRLMEAFTTEAKGLEAPAEPGTEKVTAGVETLETQGKIATARQEAQSLLDGDLKAVVDAGTAFGTAPNPPGEWAVETDRIAASLKFGDDDGLDKITTAIAEARLAIAAQKKTVEALTTDRKTWEVDWADYERQRDALGQHPAAAAAPILAPFNTLKDGAEAAKTQVATYDFKAAKNDLAKQVMKFADLTQLADASAQYKKVLAKREPTVPASAADGTPQLATAKGKAVDLLKQAKDLALTSKFGDATAKLNEIPAAIDNITRITTGKRYYDHRKGLIDPDLLTWNALDPKYKTHLQPIITAIETALGEAANVATTDLFRASTVIEGVLKLRAIATTKATDIKVYVDKRALFDPEFQKVEDKNTDEESRPGIQEFYLRANRDKVFCDTCVVKGDFVVGSSILDKVQPLIAAQLALAEKCKIYVTHKKSVLEKIKEIRLLNTTGAATAELAVVDTYLSAATALETAKDFDKAKKEVDEALVRANAAKTLLEAEKALGDLKAPAGTDLSALQARDSAYDTMRSNVVSKPGSSDFTSLLGEADTHRLQAQGKMQEPVDLTAAAAAFDKAEATLQDALVKILRKPGYDTKLAAAKLQADTTLPGLNVLPNKCIDDEINKIKQAITRAENLAKTPDFKFGDAEKELADAAILAGRSTEKVAKFAGLVADRAIIKNLITYVGGSVSGVAMQPALSAEKQRLEKIQADIDKELAAFNFDAAATLTAEGKALDAPYRTLCTNYKTASEWRTTYYNEATAIAGNPLCKFQTDEQAQLKPQIDKMIDVDHAFVAAQKLIVPYIWATSAGTAIIASHDQYKLDRKAEADLWTPLKTREHPDMTAITLEIDGIFNNADAMASRREFKQVAEVLKPLHVRLTEIKKQADDYALVVAARGTTDPLIAEVNNHTAKGSIAPLLDLINAKKAHAEDMVKRSAFGEAAALLNELVAQCAAAKNPADSFTEFDALGQGTDAPDKSALEQAIEKVKEKIAALQGVSGNRQLPGRIVEARTTIAEAETKLKSGTEGVADLIKAASAACGAAEVHAQQYDQIETQQIAALKLVSDFTGGGHAAKAFVDARMKANAAIMATALQTMTASGAAAATRLLVDATSTFRADVALADRRAAYDKLRLTLVRSPTDTTLKTLREHPNRYAAAEEIKTLEDSLDEADGYADAANPDFDKAMAALKTADDAATAGKLIVAMHSDTATPPTKEDITKLLAQPGGEAKLDKIMEGLDPTVRRQVMMQATECRFGCKVNFFKADVDVTGNNEFGPDLQRYYQNLKKLPPKHVLKNDSLLIIKDYKNATGTAGPGAASSYNGGEKRIAMREGPAATSSGRGMGASYAVGDGSDPRFTPANDDTVKMFDWNGQHEVGHSVDEQYHVMATHKGDGAYGGWTHYGRDYRAIGEKLVAEFDYDLAYAQAKLAGDANPPLPTLKPGVEPDVWEQRRLQVDNWVKMAASANNPWETNALANALKLKDGEIIHESQDGMYYGYPASERAKGITGYQFRSPLEWFSELYAAYHTGKLKPTHPAVSWLSTLGT